MTKNKIFLNAFCYLSKNADKIRKNETFYACLTFEESFDGLKIGGVEFDSYSNAVNVFKESIKKFKGIEFDVYLINKTTLNAEPNSLFCEYDKNMNLQIIE
jgi:hypothetical protein